MRMDSHKKNRISSVEIVTPSTAAFTGYFEPTFLLASIR